MEDRLKTFQKTLRDQSTAAEHRLWQYLRNRRLLGHKFRRQHILQGYIVDFVCLEKKLVIELDGGQHSDQVSYDSARTNTLEQDGFQVIRFWNDEALKNTQTVLDVILDALNKEV